VKHVDSLAELREVKDTMFNTRVDSDFINPLANTCHRLPVWGFQPLLDEVQKVPSKASDILRKRSDIVERRSGPEDGFFRHEGSIQIFVYVVNVT
jgi:hypothetical protein